MVELCEKCLKRMKKLCEECAERVENGKIQQSEIDLARAMYDLKPEFKALRNVEVEKAFDLGEVTFIVVPNGQGGKIIGKGGRVVRALSESLQRRLRIIEQDVDEHKTIKTIISPVKLNSVNVLYTQEGEKYRIKVPEKELSMLPMDINDATKTISILTGKTAEIIGE